MPGPSTAAYATRRCASSTSRSCSCRTIPFANRTVRTSPSSRHSVRTGAKSRWASPTLRRAFQAASGSTSTAISLWIDAMSRESAARREQAQQLVLEAAAGSGGRIGRRLRGARGGTIRRRRLPRSRIREGAPRERGWPPRAGFGLAAIPRRVCPRWWRQRLERFLAQGTGRRTWLPDDRDDLSAAGAADDLHVARAIHEPHLDSNRARRERRPAHQGKRNSNPLRTKRGDAKSGLWVGFNGGEGGIQVG